MDSRDDHTAGLITNCSQELKDCPGHSPDQPLNPSGSRFISLGGELSLSNPGQLKLLEALVGKGAALRTTVRGFSMTPLIRDGDVLTITPRGERKLNSGDVAAFRHPKTGRLVIHRIVGGNRKGLILKGDYCLKIDGLVKEDEVMGVVVKVERKNRLVRFGSGPEKKLIALLSRFKLFVPMLKLLTLPFRGASFSLRVIQSLPLYRKVGGRYLKGTVVSAAGEKELEDAYRMINPTRQYKKRPASPNVSNLVVKINGRVVGFTQLVCRPPERRPFDGFWLCSMHVQAEYRGLGLGEKLARATFAEALIKNAPRVFLLVDEKNRRAIGLYKKLGFRAIENDELKPHLERERQRTGKRKLLFEIDPGVRNG